MKKPTLRYITWQERDYTLFYPTLVKPKRLVSILSRRRVG